MRVIQERNVIEQAIMFLSAPVLLTAADGVEDSVQLFDVCFKIKTQHFFSAINPHSAFSL